MARHTAWMRPRHSQIYALCEREGLAAKLALSWAVTPFVVPFDLIDPQNTIEPALSTLMNKGRLRVCMTLVRHHTRTDGNYFPLVGFA